MARRRRCLLCSWSHGERHHGAHGRARDCVRRWHRDGTTISGGTLEITSGGSVEGEVEFAAHTGKLLLDVTTFSGTVAGMTAQDSIDLRDFKFGATHVTSAVTTTSTTLTVTDGSQTAQILLLGNYTASTFTKSNDGFGGTSIVDPPGTTSASLVSLAQTHKG